MERSIGQTTEKKPSAGLEKTNYRPVSSLGFISKILEKVTLTQFAKQSHENEFVPTYHSVYRRNHRCEMSLGKLVDGLLGGMEDQLTTAVIILDLLAAFNTVDHKLLLNILEKKFGINDKTKQWYHNYIRSSKFRVIIGKDKSEPRQLDYSVPQGSIQGTFLFISYGSN